MKVSELIEQLKQFDPQLEVWVDSREGDDSVFDAVDIIYDNGSYGHGVVIITE